MTSSEVNNLMEKKKKRSKPKKKEESIQLQVSKYLRSQYPGVIFNSDIASGMRLPIWIAAKAKAQRSGRGQPDLVILEPRGKFGALCIELKRDGIKIFKQNGDVIADKHIQEQYDLLCRLRGKGYCAEFACGFSQAKLIIDQYFCL